MNDETFETRHEPHTIRQVETCVDAEDRHAAHRRLTDLALYYCNCGVSTGWVPLDTLPQSTDFIRNHLPPGVTWPWPDEVSK